MRVPQLLLRGSWGRLPGARLTGRVIFDPNAEHAPILWIRNGVQE